MSEANSFFRKYLWTYDHKMIAIQYMWTALAFLFLGGGLALLVRYQLAWPNTEVPLVGRLLPDTVASEGAIIPGGYNMLVTMHATDHGLLRHHAAPHRLLRKFPYPPPDRGARHGLSAAK